MEVLIPSCEPTPSSGQHPLTWRPSWLASSSAAEGVLVGCNSGAHLLGSPEPDMVSLFRPRLPQAGFPILLVRTRQHTADTSFTSSVNELEKSIKLGHNQGSAGKK